jgi:hypothetical protein
VKRSYFGRLLRHLYIGVTEIHDNCSFQGKEGRDRVRDRWKEKGSRGQGTVVFWVSSAYTKVDFGEDTEREDKKHTV